ncbi:MAG: MATE family efflux transporter [Pseudomonadota bacterium]
MNTHSFSSWRESVSRRVHIIRRALRGDEVDVTSIPLRRAIAFLAIPMVAEMFMESLFAITDIFWVAGLGADAIAVVGLTEAVIVLIEAVAVGVGMAVTAMIARRTGEGEHTAAAVVAGQAIWVGAVLSLTFGSFGMLFASDILQFMGATDSVIDTGVGFTRLMLGGSVAIVCLYLLGSAFRGAGEPAIAMKALWIGNGLNIVLDPILIYGFGPIEGIGVEGAAIASILGRGTGAAYLVYRLLQSSERLPIAASSFALDLPVMRRLLSIASGGVAQFLIGTASWIVLMRIVASYGSDAVAGYTLAVRIIIFGILPAWGLANAAATLVGQNLGAKHPERAAQGVWMTARYSAVFLGAMALLFGLGAPVIVGWFSDSDAVTGYAVQCLQIMSVGYVIYGFGMTIIQGFNGAGDTRTPTILNFVCFWLLQIPLAYLLAEYVNLGPTGVFITIVASELVLTIWGIILFRRGNWARSEV